MILAYLWIDRVDLNPDENHDYNFYGKYSFRYKHLEHKIIVEENNQYIDDFYKITKNDKSCFESLTCIVGGNGSGKTSLINKIKAFAIPESTFNRIEAPYIAIIIEKSDDEKWYCVYDFPSEFPKNYYENLELSDETETGRNHKEKFSKHNLLSFIGKYRQNLAVIQYSNYLDENIDFDSEFNTDGFYDIQTKTLINFYASNYKAIHGDRYINQLSLYKMEEYKNFFDYFLGINTDLINDFTSKYFKSTDSEHDQIMRKYAYLKPVELSYEDKCKKYSEKVGEESIIIKYFDSINTIIDGKIRCFFDKLNSEANKTEDIYNYHKWIYAKTIWLLLIDIFNNILEKNTDISALEKIFGNLTNLDFDEPIDFLNKLQQLVLRHYVNFVDINIPKLFENINNFLELLCKCKNEENQLIDYLRINIQDKESNGCLSKIIDTYMKIQSIPNFGNFCEFGWWRPLSSGEHAMLTLFSRLYKTIKNLKMHEKNLLVLIDEGEIGFHPYWQKRYVASLIEFFEMALKVLKRKDIKIQLTITTNNPIPLSDIQPSDVLYLESHKVNELKNKKAFGTDLLTLYSDSFFINDGLIGKFADNKIKELIKRCKGNESLNDGQLNDFRKLANNVGDEFIKQYLLELIQNREIEND